MRVVISVKNAVSSLWLRVNRPPDLRHLPFEDSFRLFGIYGEQLNLAFSSMISMSRS